MKRRDTKNSNRRVLDLYLRLAEGNMICIKDEVERTGVSSRSIKRDIAVIRACLADLCVLNQSKTTLIYDKKKNAYTLSNISTNTMTNSEILAVCKILLKSRAFTKEEMEQVLNKMIGNCISENSQKIVSDLIGNERFHYIELSHKSTLLNHIWDLEMAVKHHKLIHMSYQKQNLEGVEKWTVEPVALLFSEYYFYLVAYTVDVDGEKEYANPKDNYLMIYRVDKIADFQVLKNEYLAKKRVEEGELRKRIPFMYSGELMRIQFRYTGEMVEDVLDKIPTAEIKRKDKNEYIIDAEIFGEGVLRWILSQGEDIEVIRPEKLRKKVEEVARQVLGKYEKSSKE